MNDINKLKEILRRGKFSYYIDKIDYYDLNDHLSKSGIRLTISQGMSSVSIYFNSNGKILEQ